MSSATKICFQNIPILSNRHFQTITPYLFRKLPDYKDQMIRIDTPDDDFLDLDLYQAGSNHVVILTHGLEGSSNTSYMKGMAQWLRAQGYDVIAWNMRSCSGEMNRTKKFYHAAATQDLDTVVDFALNNLKYKHVSLMGFSIGANITLMYLGEKKEKHVNRIEKGIAISCPSCIKSSVEALTDTPMGKIYTANFLRTMKQKIIQKAHTIPLPEIDFNELPKVKTFKEFDDLVTAPLFGYRNAADYYHKASSNNVLHQITTPTLIINAKDDPFLRKNSFPIQAAKENHSLLLEITETGGHLGFMQFGKGISFWTEKRSAQFLSTPF